MKLKLVAFVVLLWCLILIGYYHSFESDEHAPDVPINTNEQAAEVYQETESGSDHNENLNPQSLTRDESSPHEEISQHTRVEHTKVVAVEKIQQIVNQQTQVADAEMIGSVLRAENFSELVEQINRQTSVSLETDKYQRTLMDYVHNSDVAKYMSNYTVNCNNQLCLGYFYATEPEDLKKAVELLKSADFPSHASGFKTLYFSTDDQGAESLRVAFNSDPRINAIKSQKHGEFSVKRTN